MVTNLFSETSTARSVLIAKAGENDREGANLHYFKIKDFGD